ncbi:type II toxin-antitoxin system RelE/ParE family toxin [Mycobacterium sp.]|uniref:type II toxin-antitoxin system RelE family toxin n=1 Tax=Mycobacterium sp. TaxID=1785 RepID=UPI0031DF0514
MSEPYQIQITARAARDLQRLPEKVATACVAFIFGPLVENPRQVSKPLRDELVGLRSARRGDYRVVYAIVEITRRIEIMHVDRRSDVYR